MKKKETSFKKGIQKKGNKNFFSYRTLSYLCSLSAAYVPSVIILGPSATCRRAGAAELLKITTNTLH